MGAVFVPALSISEWAEDAGGQLFHEQNWFFYSKKLAIDRTEMQLKWFRVLHKYFKPRHFYRS